MFGFTARLSLDVRFYGTISLRVRMSGLTARLVYGSGSPDLRHDLRRCPNLQHDLRRGRLWMSGFTARLSLDVRIYGTIEKR